MAAVACFCFPPNAKVLTVYFFFKALFLLLLGNYDWCLHFRCGVVVHKNARILIAKPEVFVGKMSQYVGEQYYGVRILFVACTVK